MKIKRNIYNNIKGHLNKSEITLIVGPRQVGKTTLIKELQDELNSKGENTMFLNLDIEDDARILNSQSTFVEYLNLKFKKQKAYVFIDEIQRKVNAGLFFKGIYDMNLPYKFILTGSGSVELKEKISESLAGRKRVFEMFPISFIEFLNYKTNYEYKDNLDEFISLNSAKINEHFNTYLNFGGYPRIILTETLDEKREEMHEIYSSYLEKDIVNLLNVKKTEAFNKLVTLLSNDIGNKINISEISNTLGVDVKTVKEYIWYLEKTFIIKKLSPYFTNLRNELSKMPVYYFIDLGLRNFALNRFTQLNLDTEGGHLFENFILNTLIENYRNEYPQVNYWRSKSGAEVDFVLNLGSKIIPIEVKYSKFTKPKIGKSLYSFIDRYSPEKAFIVNLNYNEIVKHNHTDVVFVDYKELIAKKRTNVV